MTNRQRTSKKYKIHPICNKLQKGDVTKLALKLRLTLNYVSMMVNGDRKQSDKFLAAVAELVTQRQELYKNLDEIANQ